MTTLVAHAPMPSLNWPRIGALSGTLSLHVGIVLLLLTPPVAIEVMRRADADPFVVTFVEPKPPEVVKPEPVLPKPPPKEKHAPPPRAQTVTHEAPPPVETAERNIMSYDAPPAGPPGPAATTNLPDTAPTSLMYGKQTRVQYPVDSLRRGEHGKVVLRVLVGTDGTVQAIEIEKSSGFPRLDAAARDAVRHWTFQPGTRNGVAQSAWALVPVAFDLTQI